ncbi:hypothetical protein HQ545_00710 [Candidatus Woesearchaeota archaeon]|nr:hypothetical protein [Candidatus Woesearchaeota archaeon]
MALKLEITKKLEEIEDLDNSITILNMPSANYCEKSSELVELDMGVLEQACKGCVTQGIKINERLSMSEIKQVIDYFSANYDAKFITINGRGNPLHPRLTDETMEKIKYSNTKGIQSYIFTAGNNLDVRTCNFLAENETNVMISLFGNRFIDDEFFAGKEYQASKKPLQNQAEIARNLRRLISTYEDHPNRPTESTTRLGMNYVVSINDLDDDGQKVARLRMSANENRIFFICNTDFQPHPNLDTQKRLEELAKRHSDFGLAHSTSVNGQCQMGAGSSATVDYDGELYRCPYMCGKGDGKITKLSGNDTKQVLLGYLRDRDYSCILRRTLKA